VRNRSIRASDADREAMAGTLREHAVAGRLTTDELDERAGRALAARTLGELDTLVADLPRGSGRRPAPAKVALVLLAEGVLWLLIGLLLVTIAILWGLAWAGTRLASAAARSLGPGRAPAIAAGARRPR
jgi:Domain of unknown function (DUF1707)